jgi:transcriptional regulatory protein RtcR
MLLHAIENKTFHPVGSDQTVASDFQLIAGTNKDLKAEVEKGLFREDLLARINLWSYQLPALKDRKEDIPANIDYEMGLFEQKTGQRIQFNKEAKQLFEQFAMSKQAVWRGNFRDLSSAITRLCTLANSSRITVTDVSDEIARLQDSWQSNVHPKAPNRLVHYLSEEQIANLDQFDIAQLNYVLSICEQHSSMASAGRELFDVSRTKKAQANDSTRLQKYLRKFNLAWSDLA